MSKSSTKKSVERRKGPRRGAGARAASQKAKSESKRRPKAQLAVDEACIQCGKDLRGEERALFVEEEVGRIFCSEDCITAHFTPEIERLEKEYFRHATGADLSPNEREKLAHLRWVTLQEPDEVWRQKTLSGDYRYTLISEFRPGPKPVWFICICLMLRGEPSFLYLAFPSKNESTVNFYRRGERVEVVRPEPGKDEASSRRGQQEVGEGIYADSEAEREHRRGAASREDQAEAEAEASEESKKVSEAGGEAAPPTDGLAEPWTEEENMAARRRQDRSPDDIPEGEYDAYESCFNETLETPDEVWSLRGGSDQDAEPVRLYHFIRYFGDEDPGIWFVVVARETDKDDEIEVLDAFPTRDLGLVERYRTGSQEVGDSHQQTSSGRVVH